MHAGALRALEFDRIVAAISRFAVTPLGAARLADLRPFNDPRRVDAALAATSDSVTYLAEQGAFPLSATSDLDTFVAALAVEGRALEPRQLRGLADFLDSVQATVIGIRRIPSGRLLLLKSLVESAASFEREIAGVRRAIDASGEVVDEASVELRSIRDRLRKQRARLRSMLESYLRGKETARYLQDQVVTDRHGRYVLVVRAEHRGAIPGIVHGSSTSGASLFLEPLSTVEINNEIVALAEQQAAEVHRILLALGNAFRSRALELKRTLDVATELDVLQAKGRFATLVDGIAPAMASDGRLELRGARHPLLIRAVADLLGDAHHLNERVSAVLSARRGRSAAAEESFDTGSVDQPVPVDLLIVPPVTTLVVTGPNTGGKTVALKTAGLLSLMAQAGLHIPAAAGSQITVFRSLFADVGDEQSISANLSTFSAHMTNIVAMDHALALPALVLLDEVGAGTDPVEGGALGVAIIDHFRMRGARVVATTHYDVIKTYASTTAGVSCAAFGFEPETFAPSYRLVYGSPGRSLALEIAGRLGLPSSIIERAQHFRTTRESQLADHLTEIDRQLRELAHDRRLVARERQQLAELQAQLHGREVALQSREDWARQQLRQRVADQAREARREIDRVVDELKRQSATLRAEAARRASTTASGLSTGDLGALRSEALAAVERAADPAWSTAAHDESGAAVSGQEGPALADGHSGAPSIGERVVASLGLEGIVRAVHDHEVEVDVRGKRLRVPVGELRRLGMPERPQSPVQVSVQLQPRDVSVADLNVIGCTVDEAVSRAERFLDEALIAERRTVRLIHGHGTGQLRRALAAFLGEHPLVERFRAAPPDQGGGGVTVVELKE